MSRGQRRHRDTMEQWSREANAQANADRTRLMQDTPETTWLRDIARRGADWIAKKNYSSAPPGMFKYDLADPGRRAKVREANLNLQPTGAFALGAQGANPQALAMARLRLNDQMDQDDAENYEGAVNNYMGEIKGMNADLANFDYSRNNALLGNAMNRWQAATRQWGDTANQMGSVLPGILGGALGAAGSIGAAYAGRPR